MSTKVLRINLYPKSNAILMCACMTILLSGCMSMQRTNRMPLGAGRPNMGFYAGGNTPNQQRVARPPSNPADTGSAAVDVLPAPPLSNQLSLADEPLLPSEKYESILGPSLGETNGPELVTPFSVQQTDSNFTEPAVTEPAVTEPESVPVRDLKLIVTAASVNPVRSRVPFRVLIENPSDVEIPDVVIEAMLDDHLALPGRPEKRVRRELGSLKPNESRTILLTLTSQSTGRYCCQFTLKVTGREAVWKSYCVDFR